MKVLLFFEKLIVRSLIFSVLMFLISLSSVIIKIWTNISPDYLYAGGFPRSCQVVAFWNNSKLGWVQRTRIIMGAGLAAYKLTPGSPTSTRTHQGPATKNRSSTSYNVIFAGPSRVRLSGSAQPKVGRTTPNHWGPAPQFLKEVRFRRQISCFGSNLGGANSPLLAQPWCYPSPSIQ